MKKKNKRSIIFKIILVIYLLYSAVFIFQTSLVIDGKRYFCLADDQMISMQYAKNFANGHGLVWSVGDKPVEGFTNPLWVFYMTLFHLLPIPLALTSLFIQISGVIFLFFNLIVIKKISDLISENSNFVAIIAALLTAFYFSLNYWGIHGFEISILVLLVNLAVLFTIKALKEDKLVLYPFLCLAVGILVRLDIAATYLVFIFYLFVIQKRRKNKDVVFMIVPFILAVGGQFAFNYLYYGDILPNTYYLKMAGYPVTLRIARGLLVFLDFAWKTNWVLLLLPFLLLFTKKNPFKGLLFLILLGQIAYSIYVGGDAWEWWGASNRFVVIAMPVFFVLFGLTISEIFRLIKKTFHIEKMSVAQKFCLFVFILFSLYSFNSPNAMESANDWLLCEPPFETQGHEDKLRLGLASEEITKPGAKIAVVWAGIIPYFTDRQYIDLLGKNDEYIGHMEMKKYSKLNPNLLSHNNFLNSKYTFFYPGHMKWDYAYSIGQLKPDVIIELWYGYEDAMPYLKDYTTVNYRGVQLIVNKDSEYIHWDKVNIMRQ